MKILITGANGFSGRKMQELLRAKNKLTLADISTAPHVTTCDLTNFEQTLALLRKTKPQKIYHFTGSFTNNYERDYKCNVVATKNILDAVLELKLKTRILLIGSSAEYGMVKKKDNPIAESYPLNPVSIYGLTKVYQTKLMQLYCALYNMDIVMARTFNLMGKGLSPQLFIGKLYQQIELYKAGKLSHITVGNTGNKRDYISIDEAIKYYRLIMDEGEQGEVYNVGTSKSIQISALLKNILKEEKLKSTAVKAMTGLQKNKMDVSDIRADIKKLNRLSASFKR